MEEEDEEENSYVGGIWGVDDYFHEDGPPEGHIPYYGPADKEEEDEEENSYVGGIWGVDDYFHEDGPPEGHIPYYGYYYGSD